MARDYNADGLKAAARVFANTMRRVAGVKTRRGAEAVNIQVRDGEVLIRAGKPEGAYGWDPIQAAMFDDNLRHPLYGDKKHWYHQGSWPITETTVKQGADPAADAYADAAIDSALRDHGFS